MPAPHAVITQAGPQVRRNEEAIRETERIFGVTIRTALDARYNDTVSLLRILGFRCAECAAYVSGYRFTTQGHTSNVKCRDCSRLHS